MRTKDAEKQQRIKDALVRLILREGINGASVSKIAREAGVSPATIYIYYENKEQMLAEVFQECASDSYRYLLRLVRPEMRGDELIETLVRGYFSYTLEHAEVFSFVEQCSRCPTLSWKVPETQTVCEIFDLIHQYQTKGEVKCYSDMNIAAMLFYPVRFLAMDRCTPRQELAQRLDELVQMLQDMLLD